MPRAVTSGYRARDSDANIQAAARPSPPPPVCAPPPAARPAQDWIEALTGTVVDPDRLGDELRNGVVLCELACAISPGIVKRISDSPLPYKQMDNIAAFSAACKKLGVPEHDCFDTIDLFEGKDIVAVVQTIHALGRTVQLSREDLPKLGPRLATANRRQFAAVFTDDQLRRASVGAVPMQTRGATIDRLGADQSKSPTWGNQQAGAGDTRAPRLQTAGASIDRLPVDQSASITFRASHAAPGDAPDAPALHWGAAISAMEPPAAGRPGARRRR
ncbi:hypothetical protein JL721_10229 [Aureococcus anophagefferens]|nr:hypothetical protein JL721_10229 [Aureococcus anophagefferens]